MKLKVTDVRRIRRGCVTRRRDAGSLHRRIGRRVHTRVAAFVRIVIGSRPICRKPTTPSSRTTWRPDAGQIFIPYEFRSLPLHNWSNTIEHMFLPTSSRLLEPSGQGVRPASLVRSSTASPTVQPSSAAKVDATSSSGSNKDATGTAAQSLSDTWLSDAGKLRVSPARQRQSPNFIRSQPRAWSRLCSASHSYAFEHQNGR